MSAFIILLAALLSGHAHVVAHDAPTGDLHRGDVVIELGTTIDECNDRGGIPLGTVCIGEDF